MKTKKMFMAIVLFVLSSSAFAKVHQSFKLPANQLPFDALPYRSLTNTTSYSVNVLVDDQGANGTTDPANGDVLHNYYIAVFVTDSATPAWADRYTLPGNFQINATSVTETSNDANYNYVYDNFGINIGSGASYASVADSGNYFIGGTDLQLSISGVTLQYNTFGGLPIYFNYTVQYYTGGSI